MEITVAIFILQENDKTSYYVYQVYKNMQQTNVNMEEIATMKIDNIDQLDSAKEIMKLSYRLNSREEK